MKRLIGILLALSTILLVVLVTNSKKEKIHSEKEKSQQVSTRKASKADTALSRTHHSRTDPENLTEPPFVLGKSRGGVIPELLSDLRSDRKAPYQYQGGPGSGRIVDMNGKVIMSSNDEIGIFGISLSPDQLQILAKGGDAVNYVIKPSSGDRIKLPSFPAGENMLGLNYHWIDNQNLLGISGIQARDSDGKLVTNDNNIEKTTLYIYSLKTQNLIEISLPPEVTQPVVEIPEMGIGGYFRLSEHAADGSNEKDLGWFDFNSRKSSENW